MSIFLSCNVKQNKLSVDVYETSTRGNKLQKITEFHPANEATTLKLLPEQKYQTITGFGGSFTEASAHLLNQLSKENRELVLNAYFASEGAKYSLTRTHINSCDFSLSNYSYTPVEEDKELASFTIDEDTDDLIPMIKEAMAKSEDGFKIIASPWANRKS
jgi:glucosylceramidase